VPRAPVVVTLYQKIYSTTCLVLYQYHPLQNGRNKKLRFQQYLLTSLVYLSFILRQQPFYLAVTNVGGM
jgi:hypothetical protein